MARGNKEACFVEWRDEDLEDVRTTSAERQVNVPGANNVEEYPDDKVIAWIEISDFENGKEDGNVQVFSAVTTRAKKKGNKRRYKKSMREENAVIANGPEELDLDLPSYFFENGEQEEQRPPEADCAGQVALLPEPPIRISAEDYRRYCSHQFTVCSKCEHDDYDSDSSSSVISDEDWSPREDNFVEDPTPPPIPAYAGQAGSAEASEAVPSANEEIAKAVEEKEEAMEEEIPSTSQVHPPPPNPLDSPSAQQPHQEEDEPPAETEEELMREVKAACKMSSEIFNKLIVGLNEKLKLLSDHYGKKE